MVEDTQIKKNFGCVVRELRTSKDLTQEKLAEFLDLQTQTITAIETGKSFISCEVLTKLSNFFNVHPSIFFLPKVRIYDTNKLNYINEIKPLLSSFSQEKLKEIYNILVVMLNY